MNFVTLNNIKGFENLGFFERRTLIQQVLNRNPDLKKIYFGRSNFLGVLVGLVGFPVLFWSFRSVGLLSWECLFIFGLVCLTIFLLAFLYAGFFLYPKLKDVVESEENVVH